MSDNRIFALGRIKINKQVNNIFPAVAGAVFAVFFALTPVFFFAGWLGYAYLLLTAVVDLWMIRCAILLLKDRSVEDGHVQVKRLYLS